MRVLAVSDHFFIISKMNETSCFKSRDFINIYIINRTLHGRLGTRILSSRAERYLQHSKIKFVSPRGHVISSIYPTRPSVRVHWVACGTCSVPGNFFQVGVCSRYNARSDWLIVTSPRADYVLAKTKQKVIKKPYNKLLTNRASSSLTGEYWPWVVFVRTSLRSVRTATTSGQYSPVRPSRSVSKKL